MHLNHDDDRLSKGFTAAVTTPTDNTEHSSTGNSLCPFSSRCAQRACCCWWGSGSPPATLSTSTRRPRAARGVAQRARRGSLPGAAAAAATASRDRTGERCPTWTAGRLFALRPVPSAVPSSVVQLPTMPSSVVPSVPSWAVPLPLALLPVPSRQRLQRLSEARRRPPARPRPSTAGPRSPYGPSGRLQPARYTMVSLRCHRLWRREWSGGKGQALTHQTQRRAKPLTCMPSLTRESARALSLSLYQLGGRVRPIAPDPVAADPFLLLAHHRHSFSPGDPLRAPFRAIGGALGLPYVGDEVCMCVCVCAFTHACRQLHTHTTVYIECRQLGLSSMSLPRLPRLPRLLVLLLLLPPPPSRRALRSTHTAASTYGQLF